MPTQWKSLQFRLRNFLEHDSIDVDDDEVFLSAVGLDSTSVRVGPDKKPVADLIHAGQIGDVSEDSVRGSWRAQPHVLLEFNLLQGGNEWPRTYTVTLFIVEEDAQELAESFNELHSRVGNLIKTKVVAAAAATGQQRALPSVQRYLESAPWWELPLAHWLPSRTTESSTPSTKHSPTPSSRPSR